MTTYLADCPLPIDFSEKAAMELGTVEELLGKGWKPEKVMAALGHPGYSRRESLIAFVRMERFGMTSHEAIYGGGRF